MIKEEELDSNANFAQKEDSRPNFLSRSRDKGGNTTGHKSYNNAYIKTNTTDLSLTEWI